jgi:integrase
LPTAIWKTTTTTWWHLADILGHSDLNTTRIYTKRRLSDLQEGAERVQFF